MKSNKNLGLNAYKKNNQIYIWCRCCNSYIHKDYMSPKIKHNHLKNI